DDLFKDAEIPALAETSQGPQWAQRVEHLFSRLSSGHSIVLLTITKLVELVDEKTLVFLDEPEGHLHPPLLSAFIRCLSDLLVKRNGVAIVATHSPVVLQEVPRDCAWKLRRSGTVSFVERPLGETFGENVGVLTRDVFGYEVTHSGFHTLLTAAVNEGRSFDQITSQFGEKLGGEARALVRALIIDRNGRQP
ncbi:MAG TPA: AAA family ATPase, partial [Fontimonas sp.]